MEDKEVLKQMAEALIKVSEEDAKEEATRSGPFPDILRLKGLLKRPYLFEALKVYQDFVDRDLGQSSNSRQ